MEEIIINIDSDANVQLTVKGVKGPSCRELTDKIEKAIGKVDADRTTSEFHQKGEHHVGH